MSPSDANGLGPYLPSWSLRIRGHGDFENFPAIPVDSDFSSEAMCQSEPGTSYGDVGAAGGADEQVDCLRRRS
jgi:hypothetical protein